MPAEEALIPSLVRGDIQTTPDKLVPESAMLKDRVIQEALIAVHQDQVPETVPVSPQVTKERACHMT
jgi:hypothetical protein